jgi:alpha-tubulin suppressor-like RCC1 family protein
MKKILFIFSLLVCYTTCNAQCWQFITAGDAHCLGIKSNGTLWAWGLNATGQLGDGTYIDKNIPTQVGTDADWLTASAGNNFSYAIKKNGTMYSWGNNNKGQLSDNTIIGRNTPLQVGTNSNWLKVSCSYDFVIAQKSDNSFWACGYNIFAQLGQGNQTDPYKLLIPVSISGTFISFKAGFRHTVLLKSDHTFWGWGEGEFGKLASGNNGGYDIPAQPVPNNDWEQITSSHHGTLFKKTNGTIWAVGQNTSGALGFGNYNVDNFTIQQIGTDNDWRSIEDSKYCSMIIKNNGTLWSCGRNNTGQQGNGNTTQTNILAQVGTATNWDKVRCGLFHTIALTNTGTLMAWGDNTYGQLGNGTFTSSLVPIQIGSACLLSNTSFTKENVKVYPNPYNESFKIAIPQFSSENVTVKVYDMLGKTIEVLNLSVLELQQHSFGKNYSSGVYTIIVTQAEETKTIKVIKQ